MINTASGWLFSAQDLTAFMDCKHAAALNRRVLTDPVLKQWRADQRAAAKAEALASGLPERDPQFARGDQHERAVLARLRAEGQTIAEVDSLGFDDAAIDAGVVSTLDAMRAGADVIYQAVLRDGPWFGFADFLVKVEGTSDLGEHVYEVHDTKLARSLKAKALIQLAHYGLILEKMQGAPPPRLVVVLGDESQAEWPFEDAAPYVEQLRGAVLDFHQTAEPTSPEPVAACSNCKWLAHCEAAWGPDDLRNVQRLTRRQRTQLIEHGIPTMSALTTTDDTARPRRMSEESFERLRAQAQVQTGGEAFQVITPHPAIGGFVDVPEPHTRDVYFDLEGDPFAAAPTLDYLWAYCQPNGTYHSKWAHDPDAERVAFLWFLDELRAREAEGGDWHVYHYNTYEITSMRRVVEHWPDEHERAALRIDVERLIDERFDDLYRRVEQGLRTQDGSTSLKIVEKLAGYDRTKDAAVVARGDDSIKAYEYAIAEGTDPAKREALLRGIEHYNTHDVRATHAVHGWLRTLGSRIAESDTMPVEASEPFTRSDETQQRIDATEAAELRLSAAITDAENRGGALPCGLSVEGATTLLGMLAWHRREEVVQWTDFFRLCEWASSGESDTEPDVDATLGQEWVDLNGEPVSTTTSGVRDGAEHEQVLQDIAILEAIPPSGRKKKTTYAFSCAEGAWKVKEGAELRLLPRPSGDGAPEEAKPITITLDTFDAAKGEGTFGTTAELPPIHAFVLSPLHLQPTPWESLMRLAERAHAHSPSKDAVAGLRLLDRIAPTALLEPAEGLEAADRARAAAARLAPGDTLPVQGPPGTGKTWLAANAIVDEIERCRAARRPARIGVTANSHKVIDNLLTEVLDQAVERGIHVTVAHASNRSALDARAEIEQLKTGADAVAFARAADGDDAVVVGGTVYAWSREDAQGCLDLLVVDEAGQVTLANALAVAQAAPRVLAVGDPQQLAAPIQAAHEESVKVSLLEHLIQGRPRIDDAAGVFLNVTHRMHPDLCAVVGRLAYASTLRSSRKAAARRIEGPELTVSGRSVSVQPGVAHLPVKGGEDAEIAATVELVEELIKGSVQASDPDAPNTLVPLDAGEVLVVAPHNATVNRLRAALDDIYVEVGTVDKFQGRQANVVVFAMGRTAETPSDVPFLYELNRINVALSRARLLAIVVSSPGTSLPPVGEPEHLMLASRFNAAMRAFESG